MPFVQFFEPMWHWAARSIWMSSSEGLRTAGSFVDAIVLYPEKRSAIHRDTVRESSQRERNQTRKRKTDVEMCGGRCNLRLRARCLVDTLHGGGAGEPVAVMGAKPGLLMPFPNLPAARTAG